MASGVIGSCQDVDYQPLRAAQLATAAFPGRRDKAKLASNLCSILCANMYVF